MIVFLISTVIGFQHVVNDFDQWLLLMNKSYKTRNEYDYRKNIWTSRKTAIGNHNANPENTYKMELNKFSDMTFDEFKDTVLMTPRHVGSHFTSKASSYSSVNWNIDGLVQEVNDQSSCGSCWAFSAAEMIAARYAIENNVTSPVLSPQQLVDCVTADYDCYGCDGGWPHKAAEYMLKNLSHGLIPWHLYPYVAYDQTCNYTYSNQTMKVKATTVKLTSPGSQPELLKALYSSGPISVCIYATENFMSYASGVFTDVTCQGSYVNHAVLLYGLYYDPKSKLWAYMIRNSWGLDTKDSHTGWGLSGDIFMNAEVYNGNMCQMTYSACYLQ